MKVKFYNPNQKSKPELVNQISKEIFNSISGLECSIHHKKPECKIEYLKESDSFDFIPICCCKDFKQKIEDEIRINFNKLSGGKLREILSIK